MQFHKQYIKKIQAKQNRKILLFSLGILFICSISVFGVLELGWFQPQGIITEDKVVLHDEETIYFEGNVIGVMSKGDKVRILDEWKYRGTYKCIIVGDDPKIDSSYGYGYGSKKLDRGREVEYVSKKGEKDLIVLYKGYNDDKQEHRVYIDSSYLQKIEMGDKFYQVYTARYGKGWVYGGFVHLNK